jgi:hypothetical protein
MIVRVENGWLLVTPGEPSEEEAISVYTDQDSPRDGQCASRALLNLLNDAFSMYFQGKHTGGIRADIATAGWEAEEEGGTSG